VFPAVVIDLGSQVAPNEAAWVLEACNAAIVSGTCELDTSASEPGRALAIVRWESEARRSVRIEVGLRAAERADWSVREMEFSGRDPARERWRSIGLVLATLVGEVEAARAQRPEQGSVAAGSGAQPAGGSPPPAAAAATETAASETAATETAASETAASARTQTRSVPRPAASAEPDAPARDELAGARTSPVPARRFLAPELPVIRPTTFVAAGVLAGSSADLDPLRWGGGVRGGWISPAGWVLSAAGDYSRSTLRQGALEAEWLRLAAGAGYRHWWSKRWSFELGVELGARALSVVPKAAGSIQSTAWSPQAALHGEIWWQALASAGAWLGLSASSIGRETHLVGFDGEPEAEVPWAESHGMFGIWWAP
jgi:hypothetical protein